MNKSIRLTLTLSLFATVLITVWAFSIQKDKQAKSKLKTSLTSKKLIKSGALNDSKEENNLLNHSSGKILAKSLETFNSSLNLSVAVKVPEKVASNLQSGRVVVKTNRKAHKKASKRQIKRLKTVRKRKVVRRRLIPKKLDIVRKHVQEEKLFDIIIKNENVTEKAIKDDGHTNFKSFNDLEMKVLPVKGENSFEINNEELIDHYGFEVDTEKTQPSMAALLRNFEVKKGMNVEQMLASERDKEDVNEKIKSIIELEKSDILVAKSDIASRTPADLVKPMEVSDFVSFEEKVISDFVEERKSAVEKNPNVSEVEVKEVKTVAPVPTQVALKQEKSSDENGSKQSIEDRQKELWENFSLEQVSVGSNKLISSTVAQAYEREKEKLHEVTSQTVATTQRSMQKVKARKEDKVKNWPVKKTEYPERQNNILEKQALASLSAAKQEVNTRAMRKVSSDYSDLFSAVNLRAKRVAINSKVGDTIRGMEFIPEYNRFDALFDNNEGLIKLEYDINNKMSVLRGTLVHRDSVETKIDVVIDEEVIDMTIPLFNRFEFESFIGEKGLGYGGGHVLIDLDEKIENVEIESAHALKVYLNDNFREVRKEESYRYVFFLNVDLGNTLISFETFAGSRLEKIIHVSEGEIYYDINSFSRGRMDSIELFERGIFAKFKTKLQIKGEDIKYFNRDIYAKLAGLNRYEYKFPGLPLGMRKYFRLSHLNENIFVGTLGKKKIVVPGEDYIKHVIKYYGVDEISALGQRCVVQLNLNKQIVKFEAEGETHKGPMSIEKRFLDKDGELGETPAILTETIFMFGEVEGLISGKVEYLDGKVDFFQTICKGNTYLVEQF